MTTIITDWIERQDNAKVEVTLQLKKIQGPDKKLMNIGSIVEI
jgi:hypothetical protein